MSGDVQPRKRKDKKKRKDELGIEEPRGTAAALGDGDVFLHSQHDHTTGGHWCAKIIFFSLLGVLITLIGLIILENRGLTELEANSVETKYSGVLEGWIEEPSEDDHYDAHTLDLNHPEEDEHHDTEGNYDHEDDDHEDEDHDEEGYEDEDHDDEEDDHEEDEDEDETNNIDENEDSEENLEEVDEESEEKNTYQQYVYDEKDDDDNDRSIETEDKDDEENEDDDDESEQGFDIGNDLEAESNEDQDEDEHEDNSNEYQEDQQASNEHNTEEDNLEDDDDQNGEEDEIEKIEAETQDWESYEDEKATSRDDDVSNEIRSERSLKDSKEISKENDDDEDEGFDDTEGDDDEPPVERITTPPAGKPFVEIEEETIQKPIDTLAEEAEYEKKQEELRRQKEEEAQASQIWLKLAVGGALLVATHAVLRRATSSRDAPEPEERSREETPSVIDRRMTLIAEEPPKVVSPPQTSRQIVDEEVFKKPAPVVKTAPIVKPNIEEVVKEKEISFVQTKIPHTNDDEDKELYSDEDEEVEEEEEEEEDVQPKIKVAPQQAPAQTKDKEEDSEPEEVPDDVEIIEDEQIEEELEEEEDEVEEEISDVDDAELLSRLEAKYGRLPEPERPGKQQKDGGNSIEDQWPGEPSDPYWREQLDRAEEELRQGSWALCEKLVSAPQLADSGRARWVLAKALDATAEAKRDNVLLSKAISAYLNLLKMNELISDKKLVEVAQRTIDRIQFRGTYLNAEPIYRLLIRRFPNDVNYRNNLTVSFLMANRADLAEEVLKETLMLWPHDRIALAHHGFVLKNQYNKLEEAVVALQKALEGDSGPANEARFYYHLGDALLSLGRFDEAHVVHKRGTKLGHFLSPSQRSLYNVPRLKSSPWWPVELTPYVKLARALENSWREILKEGELAKALYEKEKEGLKERGEWSQLDIFVRGREIPGRCKTAPVTCSIVRSEVAAAGCRRGQIKFSAIEPGTHIRPHVGPTNCRLRMHLGLKNTKDTYIRVDKETRQWQVGKTFIFDDSFEHEVWHNGTGSRLVLIVDLWHPQLTPLERKQLPAI